MAFTSSDVDRLAGASVRGAGGEKIGSIGQVYVDPDGSPVWATVRTGFFGTSESFIPLDRASAVDDDVHVPFTKDVIRNAPRVESDGELTEAETDGLYDYYDAQGSDRGGVGDRDDAASGAAEGVSGPGRADTGDAFGDQAGAADSHRADGTAGVLTDDAMTRSEERLKVGTRKVESGRARLRKHVVTQQQTVTVPVTHEVATLVREPITDADAGAAAGTELSEEEHEIVLHGEEVVTSTRTVAVERVRLATRQVTEQQQVTEEVRKERIDYVAPDGATGTTGTGHDRTDEQIGGPRSSAPPESAEASQSAEPSARHSSEAAQ